MRRPSARQSLAAFLVPLAAALVATPAAARGGPAPASFSRTDLRPIAEIGGFTTPRVDGPALLVLEEARAARGELPPRAGFPMKADLDPARDGSWEELAGGDRLWRLKVHSEGARWIVLGFGTFRPEPGAMLHVYDPARHEIQGPFTADDVREDGQLWFAPVDGDTAVVELFWPAALREIEPNLHLGIVSHGFKAWGGYGLRNGGIAENPPDDPTETDGSGGCNLDVVCPLGNAWQSQKRGAVMLLSGGSGYCSGSLVNNTANDRRPFVLTAAHCLSSQGSATSTTYRFNYERPLCGSGAAPTNQNVTGSTLRATYSTSDATLVELTSEIPDEFDAFYSGWSRATTAPTESWCIHHPSGDVKKITFNDDPLVPGQNWGPTHWRITEWELGTTEPGSSGSPLFDQNQRIVGQLHGGTASCSSITYDEYGKLDVSWNGGGTPASRLRDWLDPSSTGAVTLDGIDSIPVPRLALHALVVDDSAGNGDGVVDPGETLTVTASLRNTGTLGATGVSATLSTTHPLVTLPDPTASWPNLGPGATAPSNAPHLTVASDPDALCGDPISFTLGVAAVEDPFSWPLPFSLRFGAPMVATSFFDAMESGQNGWTAQQLSGANPWAQSTARAVSPVTSWRVGDPAVVTDSVLVMPTIPSLPPNSRLRFQHYINSESTFDGGVLEYSTNGTTWLDAGSLITTGGYTSTISTSYSSPIGGRQAWSGDFGAFRTVEADLSSLAGSNLRLRWRFATDVSVSDEGWYVDDVEISVTSYVCSTALAAPGEASQPGAGSPFHVDRNGGADYQLSWSAPTWGGAASGYRLYGSPLPMGSWQPACETELGSGTSTTMAALGDDQAFVVVAWNAAGEGPYGNASSGAPREAGEPEICP